MATTRPNRFSFTTTTPLTRLRTAFSPARSTRSISPSSTGTTSPLARVSARARAGSPDSHRSAGSTGSLRNLLMLRHRPSVLDLEMEEERHLFAHEMGVLEPRPSWGEAGAAVGIFEVLDGRV